MKATYLLLAAGLLAGCTPTPQEQAKAAVSRYVKATLHDPGSYEIVRTELRLYTRQDSMLEAAHEAANRLALASSLPGAQADSAAAKVAAVTPAQKPLRGDTTPIGWRVHLVYRVRNGYAPATQEQGNFVVYPPNLVAPLSN